MALTVTSIFNRVRRLLKDVEGIRWVDAELVDWINDAQQTTVLLKPDALSKTVAFSCAAGTKQDLPADGWLLLDVTRNLDGTKRAIRVVNRVILDSENPTWHGDAEALTTRNFTYDDRQRSVFYVYPPAPAAHSIEVVYSAQPTAVAIGGTLELGDMYIDPIVNYVAFRTLSKDADYASNLPLADSYYERFLATLGARTLVEASDNPNTAAAISRGTNRAA